MSAARMWCRVTWLSRRRRSLGCFMSAAAPRAENMLFAADTRSDCISATNAVAWGLYRPPPPPPRPRSRRLEGGETEGRRNSERACQLCTRRESGSSCTDYRLWDLDVRSAGPTHKDNRSQKLITWTTARRLPCPRRTASILEEGSPRRLPAYYQNTETSTSLT